MTLALSQANPILGGASVSVWQVPPEQTFPPGINIVWLTEANEYFLQNRVKVAPSDWIIIGVGNAHSKEDNATFITQYTVVAVVGIGL